MKGSTVAFGFCKRFRSLLVSSLCTGVSVIYDMNSSTYVNRGQVPEIPFAQNGASSGGYSCRCNRSYPVGYWPYLEGYADTATSKSRGSSFLPSPASEWTYFEPSAQTQSRIMSRFQ